MCWDWFCSWWLSVAAVHWGSRAAPTRLADPQTSKAFHCLYSERISHTDLLRLFFPPPLPPFFYFISVPFCFSFFFGDGGGFGGCFLRVGLGDFLLFLVLSSLVLGSRG